MTETVYDAYGWGSPEVIKFEARRHAWCLKHRTPYGSVMSTAGPIPCCESCYDEMRFPLLSPTPPEVL